MTEIAKAEGSEISYVARMINLTVLAPDIVASILDETIADDAKVVDLAISPPDSWPEQRRRLAE